MVTRLVWMKELTRQQPQDVRNEFNSMRSESYEIITPQVPDCRLAGE